MRHILDIINEHQGQPIDDQWINDEKAVMTRDGRAVKVISVDIKSVPNIIHGQIESDGKVFDYEWEDDGTCVRSTDATGNPSKPTKDDDLVKAE